MALPEDQKASPEFLYLLAVAQRLDKKITSAIETNHAILRQTPENARVWQELGHCYLALHNDSEAANHFYQATQRNPTLVACWRFLVGYYQRTHNEKAQKVAQQQLSWLSALPKPILGARDLLFEGELQKADAVCRQFLQHNKHQPDAMVLLAEISLEQRFYSEAEFLLESCITLHPNHYQAGLEYVQLLNQIGKYQPALDCSEGLLKQQPGDNRALLAKAGALLGIGKTQDAIKNYELLLERDPQNPYFWLLQGHALKASGNYQQAIDAYQKAAEIKSDFGDAWWSLANTKTYQFSADEITRMSRLAEASSTSADDKIHLDFALGKAYEHTKEVDQSFRHYQRGNQLKQHSVGYDISQMEKQVENQCQYFTNAFFTDLTNTGHSALDPIFIVGLPRAGSTLLEQILASHSSVEGTMELHNILSLVARLKKQNVYPDRITELDVDYLRRFGEQYIRDTQAYRTGAPFFIDKMPNNFLHIGLIKLILPNAKIIDARRNPLDCCFSGFRQLFGEGQEFSYSLENIGRYYQAYEKMMAHWQAVLPGHVLRVQHEDVIDDLENQVRRMLEFCHLPFEQSCLNFHETKRTIKTPSSEQVRQPVNRKGMDQWKPYAHHLQELTGRFS